VITADLLLDFFRRALIRTTLFDVILVLRAMADAVVYTNGDVRKPVVKVLKADQEAEIRECLTQLKTQPKGSLIWHTAGSLNVIQTLIIT